MVVERKMVILKLQLMMVLQYQINILPEPVILTLD